MGLVQLILGSLGSAERVPAERLRSALPVRNPAVSVRQDEQGSFVLESGLNDLGKGFLALLARKMNLPETKQFELDPIGAVVWEMCDGRTSFATICRALRDRYKMNRLEAETALADYLQTLSRRNLITLTVKESGPSRKLDPKVTGKRR